MNPPFAVDAGPAEAERPIHPDVQALLDIPEEELEAGVARFAAWYESQPADWIAEMDEIGRMGARKKS